MTHGSSAIYLVDGISKAPVEALLRGSIDGADLEDWSTHWVLARSLVLRDLLDRKVPSSEWPQSLHWDWIAKHREGRKLLSFAGHSVSARGRTQGLSQLHLGSPAREPTQRGKPLVHVRYLETAPWNWAVGGRVSELRGVGTALMVSAIDQSLSEGFHGRVGLHSLPQSEAFYKECCGMTDLGVDPVVQNLRYFEMTPEQARAFLEED